MIKAIIKPNLLKRNKELFSLLNHFALKRELLSVENLPYYHYYSSLCSEVADQRKEKRFQNVLFKSYEHSN